MIVLLFIGGCWGEGQQAKQEDQQEVNPSWSVGGRLFVPNGGEPAPPSLGGVSVFLEDAPRLRPHTSCNCRVTVTITETGFIPPSFCVAVGQKLELYHEHDEGHPAFIRGEGQVTSGAEPRTIVFDRPIRPATIYCARHADETKSFVVTPNRFYDVTDSLGDFRIRNIPQGKYVLVVWREGAGEEKYDIIVTKDLSLRLPLH